MKKLAFLSALFLFLSSLFLSPGKTLAQPTGSTCTGAGGACNVLDFGTCPTGYETLPIGQYGEMQCKATEACCRLLSAGCETVSSVLSCSPGYTRCPGSIGNCCIDTADCPVFPPGSLGGGGTGGNSVTCNGGDGINTALGCLSYTSTTALLQDILGIGIGIGGGIAFILMLFAGFQIMTSTGNPERLQAGKELLTSAVSGLILLVFSVFILRTIGIDILGITSLGTK